MSFLFPAMLAGLAALALPVVLHLIAKQRFPVKDFPSIRLLTGERRTNTLAPRLVDIPQLLLRLLVLLLIVLAMSRFFAPWLSSAPATHNTVIVIDASASMNQIVDSPDGKSKTTVFNLALKRAKEIVSDINAPSRASVIIAGGNTRIAAPLEPGHEHALAAVEALNKPFDASGPGLVEAIAAASDMLRGRREISSQIVVLTDYHSSALAGRSQADLQRIIGARSDLGDSLTLLFVDLAPKAIDNLAVTSAFIRGRQVMVGADAHVIATISNTGANEKTTKVTLAINDRKEPFTRSVTIAPGSKAVLDMTARVNRAMRTFAQVAVEEDSYDADDKFDVPLPIVDSRRVLIINGTASTAQNAADSMGGPMAGSGPADAAKKDDNREPDIDGATILRYVLNPGRELGGTSNSGIDPVMVTPEAVSAQPLSKYETVILYDVSSLPEQVMHDLSTFVSEGKSLLIVCSGKMSPVSFNRSLAVAGPDRSALAPAQVGNDIEPEAPLDVSVRDNTHPIVAGFSDPRKGDLSVVRFQKIRALLQVPADTNVIMESSTHQPLAVERMIGHGHVIMLTFGFELNRGNVARTRVFPPLMWRIVNYLTGQLKTLPPDQLIARTPGVLDAGETNFSLTSDLEIASASTTTQPSAEEQTAMGTGVLPISTSRNVLVSGLAPGRYLLEKARAPGEQNQIVTYARGVSVQSDPAESDMSRPTDTELKSLFGPGVRVVQGDLPGDLVPTGAEFWHIFIICLLIAYTVEALAGFISTAKREKERGPAGEPIEPAAPASGGVTV